MAIPRTAYFAQSGTLTIGNNSFVIPITSANVEVSRPLEAITSFGQFNSVNNVQTNLTTCKCSLKSYLGSGTIISGITADVLNQLILGSQSGLGIGVTVAPNGFTMSGIMDSLALDIAMGGMGMCDFGFAGIGAPITLSPPADTALTAATFSATGLHISPITTMSIASNSGALSGVYANSIKFSLSMPTDVLSALGDNPNATQGNLNSVMATKPPYKSTISIEGHGVNPAITDATASLVFGLGNIGIQLPNAKVSARSFNNAAGQISATYSVTAEDVGVVFSSLILSGYQQTGANISVFGPSYGGN